MGHIRHAIRSWANAPVKLISNMESTVMTTLREGLDRCRIGLVIVQKIQERSELSGGKRLGHKQNPGQPKGNLDGAAYRRSSR